MDLGFPALIKKRPDILRPIKLFATREGWKELDEAEDQEAMQEEFYKVAFRKKLYMSLEEIQID